MRWVQLQATMAAAAAAAGTVPKQRMASGSALQLRAAGTAS